MRLIIDEPACIDQRCSRCLAVSHCPTRALSKIDPEEPVVMQVSDCNACAKCLPVCPAGALTIG